MFRFIEILILLVYFNVKPITAQDPVRYFDYPTQIDGISLSNLTAPMWIKLTKITLTTTEQSDLLLKGVGEGCYFRTIYSNDDVDTSVSGKFYTLMFLEPHLTRMKVLNPYSKSSHNVNMLLGTKWKSMIGGNYTDLVQAINENTIINMSMEANVADEKAIGSDSCIDTEFYKIGEMFCSSQETYHKNIIQAEPTRDSNGACQIEFSAQIQHYINMWVGNSASETAFKKRCLGNTTDSFSYESYKNSDLKTKYPNFYQCHKLYKSNLPNCTDSFNKNIIYSNGKGLVSQVVVGRNNETIDVNMTIQWDRWTLDFPETFCKAFGNCDLKPDYMVMTIFVKDVIIPPVRTVPIHFWIIVFVSIFPVFVLFSIVFFCVCSRSRFGLKEEVWKFRREKKNIKILQKKLKAEKQKNLQERIAMDALKAHGTDNVI